jgi:hypothetical protein
MAQNNEVGTDKGGGGGGGGGGGPLTQACTYTYSPGLGNIIPGPQNINVLPPPYQSYPITNVTLRVAGGTQASSGDIMCSSYNTATQWSYIPGSESSGTGPLYERGCCIARWSPSDNGASTGNNNPGGPLDIVDLVPTPSTECPTINQISISVDGTQVLFNGEPLSQECCNRDFIGIDVNYVVPVGGGKGLCYVVNSSPCPPIEALSISPDQTTIIGITDQDCCNSEVTGINNVYWDLNSESCKIGEQTSDCVFGEIILENLPAHDGPGIEQVFGINIFGEQVSLTQDCCNANIAGFDVVWNPILNICERPSNLPEDSISITINQTPINVSGCTDLIVSTKLFFSQPLESCISGDISASLLPSNPNIVVEQLGIFDSLVDGFNNWVDLGIRLINTSANTNSFNIILNINGGIVECCNYDIRIDNIRVDCFKEEDRIFFDNKKCVGFDLARVIDNKKSWVYNPGIEEVGIKLNDEYVRGRGELGLIQGYGTINRTFAPSLDADIPWRYTDYYEQSNVLEPHSNLVINSKELELTFNMCSSCCVNYNKCPDGYSLITTTGGTEYCSKTEISCTSGFTLSAGTCYSATTTANTITTVLTGDTGLYCTKTLSLLELESYKKVFQSFWVRMIEQFVPATTIFIAGEKWCNNDSLICTEFEECDYDFEYFDSEITVIEYGTDFVPYTGHTPTNGGDVPSDNGSDTNLSGSTIGDPHNSNDGPIIIDGTVIVPTPSEPGEPIVITDTTDGGIPTKNNNKNVQLKLQSQTYLGTVTNGGIVTIFS